MGSVYVHGQKLWIRFKGPDGWTQRRTEFVPGQEKQARAVLEHLEARLCAGEVVRADELGPVTVERYFATWIEDRKAEISTWQNDDYVFRLYVLPTLGKLRLDEVRASHLVALVRGWRPKMAGKSVWNAYSSLSAFFRDAALADQISTSPCILTKRQLGPKEPKDPEFRASAVFTRAELEQLISDDRLPMDRRVLYALGGLAGLRHGESAGLRFRNCAMPAEPLAMIYVAFSYGRAYPKGGRCRPVPVHPTLAAILAEWKLAGWPKMMGREPTADDLVLPVPADAEARPGQMRTRQYSGDRFERDLAMLGLRHRRGHDLRRTFISLTRSDGARADVLRRVTHKPPPEVFEGYTTFEWPVVCAEVAKLQVHRRRAAEVVALQKSAARGGGRGLLHSCYNGKPTPGNGWRNSVALPGLEPGRL